MIAAPRGLRGRPRRGEPVRTPISFPRFVRYMRHSAGAGISIGASVVLLAVLGWAYIPQSARDVNVYYGSGLLNPLIAGVLAVGIVVAIAATGRDRLSPQLGAGIVLSLGLSILLVVFVWAVTGRVDVFLAPGWAFPVQRWALVGIAALIVFGAAWYARALGLLSLGR